MFERFFNMDSPIVRALIKAADVLWLNILTILLIIPVITAGPALQALHYTCLKMARDEEGYVTKMFFTAFKRKFLQSSLLGILGIAILIIFVGDIYALMIGKLVFPPVLYIAFIIAGAVAVFFLIWLFPMQARFSNPIGITMKNALWASLINAPKTLIMLLMWLFIPALILFVSANFTPLLVLFGIGGPAYFNALVYDDFFKEMEDRIRGKENHEDAGNAEEDDKRS